MVELLDKSGTVIRTGVLKEDKLEWDKPISLFKRILKYLFTIFC